MDSSKSTEDDTIRDQMELGYVATRPRNTRARDTWKVNIRNLVAEDKRALDQFVKVTAARGANAFLFPNLLPNGSFEFLPCNAVEIAQGWNRTDGNPQFSIVSTAVNAYDGAAAIKIGTVAGQVGAITAGQLTTTVPIPCTPGDVLLFAGYCQTVVGTLPGGILAPAISVAFRDANGNALSPLNPPVFMASPTWQLVSQQITVPANAATFTLTLEASLSAAGNALDGTACVLWDAVGVGLLTPVQMYGRMVGSDALPRPVRFTKIPEYSDIGIGSGVKRYGVNFELTEV